MMSRKWWWIWRFRPRHQVFQYFKSRWNGDDNLAEDQVGADIVGDHDMGN